MQIEQASQHDLTEILALQYLAYQSEARLHHNFSIPPLTQSLSDILQEFTTSIFLKAVDENGTIIGSVRARSDHDTLCIGKLIVHPDMQRRGIGTQLMHAIESKTPHRRFELFTSTKSTGNIKLYERLGYKQYKTIMVSAELEFVYLEKTR